MSPTTAAPPRGRGRGRGAGGREYYTLMSGRPGGARGASGGRRAGPGRGAAPAAPLPRGLPTGEASHPSLGARALPRGSMGDSGPRRAEAGAAQGKLAAATGSVPAGLDVQIRACGPLERGARGGRPLPVVGGGPPRMRGLYRYTLCKRKIQQRARTDRPLVAPPLSGEGRSRGGRVALALRVGLREGVHPGWEICFPPAGGTALPDRWTGPGGTRTDEPREKAPFPGRCGPSGLGAGRGGAVKHGRGRGVRPRASAGFLSKNAPPGSGRRVLALCAGGGPRAPSAWALER